MSEKRTLWNRITAWYNKNFGSTPPPVEHYNPLNIKLNGTNTITIETLDLREYTFVVGQTVEYKVDYGKKSFFFTDYCCRSALQDGDVVTVKVRVYPHDTPGRKLQTLVLKQWDELDYDENFKSLLDDQQFNTMVDGNVEAEFWRINDVKTAYQATTTELGGNDGITKETWYWDYWRETKDEAGTPYKEFLFVEWDKSDTGRFTIWRGEEVPQNCVFA